MFDLVIIVTSFVALSGLWAMIDAAILSVSPAEVEVMVTKGRWGAVALRKLLRKTTRAIIVVVILTNVTNILGPILAGIRAEELFGSQSIGFITAALTILTIIFSEVVPKSIGTSFAPRISRMAAPFIEILIYVLFPIVYVLEKIVKIFRRGRRKVGTEEQIRALANLGGGAGHIDADERELIHRAFVLNDRSTKDIMMPRKDMVFVERTSTIREAAKVVFDNSYSRYPLTGTSSQSFGYVLSKDILGALADGEGSYPVTTILRKISLVSPEMRCDDLLNFLKRKKEQIALVGTAESIIGLVTLEDVLEELVGEIEDEGDKAETQST